MAIIYCPTIYDFTGPPCKFYIFMKATKINAIYDLFSWGYFFTFGYLSVIFFEEVYLYASIDQNAL